VPLFAVKILRRQNFGERSTKKRENSYAWVICAFRPFVPRPVVEIQDSKIRSVSRSRHGEHPLTTTGRTLDQDLNLQEEKWGVMWEEVVLYRQEASVVGEGAGDAVQGA
jgi:hypothetical protein